MNAKRKIGFIIQARTNSTRLPNKILKPFINDKSILDIIIQNLINKFPTIPKILATSVNPSDQIFASFSKRWGILFFQGEENDVLKRFIDAARRFSLDGIIRICSDNPFLDMDAMDFLLSASEETSYEYISYRVNGRPSIKSHFGLWSEFVTLKTLEKVTRCTNEYLYHEHVTNYIYDNPTKFEIRWIDVPSYLTENELRFTVDTPDDFKLQQEIYKELIQNKSRFHVTDIINFVISNPTYLDQMKNQIRKNTK